MKGLIGVDFSEKSIAAADWVARWLIPEDRLTLAYSVQIPPLPGFYRLHDIGHDVIVGQAKQRAEESLAPLVQEFGPGRVDAVVTDGPPELALMGAASDAESDFVVLGPHGDASPLSGFFGSTAARVIRDATLPVVVVRSPKPRRPQRVLVALDDDELAKRVLGVAASLSESFGCEVVGLYAFETLLDGLPAFDGPSGPVDLEQGLLDTAERWVGEVMLEAGIPDDRARARAVRGHPGSVICAAAEDDVDLVIMGTHGNPVAGPTLGSVARYVVGHAPCPVMVVPGAH